jgi:hypothetical protein
MEDQHLVYLTLLLRSSACFHHYCSREEEEEEAEETPAMHLQATMVIKAAFCYQ